MTDSRWRAVVPALLAVATVSCGSDYRPATPGIVEVTMDEYRFTYDQTVPTGRVVVRATNAGELDHELLLVAIPEDFDRTLAAQLRSPTKVGFATKALLPRRGPGEVGEFATDLEPGRYGFLCFLVDDDGKNHARKGMHSEFRVRA
ncbi:MAG: hypothetical protein ACRD03_02190 [Acidimicrobiales bacterium]